MAKTRKRRYFSRLRRRVRRPKKLSIGVLTGLGAGLLVSLDPSIQSVVGSVISAVKGETTWENFGENLCQHVLGYQPRNGTWHIPTLPALTLVGYGVHKGASFIGLNRQFSRLPSPLNKIEI